jgi:HAE1 family hydrophobic/amphiphilic exporter-1
MDAPPQGTILAEAASFAGAKLENANEATVLKIFPKRNEAAFLGITALDIAKALAYNNEGMLISSFEKNGKRIGVRIKGVDYSTAEDPVLRSMNIPLLGASSNAADGSAPPKIFLGSVSTARKENVAERLSRLDRSDVSYITVDATLLKQNKRVRQDINTFIKNSGATIQQIDDSVFVKYKNSLLLTILFVLLLLYLTMGIQTESLLFPLLIMLTIPLSFAGSGPLMFITGAALDSGVKLGFVAMFGMVVNNGIILLEAVTEELNSGERRTPLRESIVNAACTRLKPVLISTLTTLVVLLPLCFSFIGGTQKSMSIAMFGGIGASCALCFIVFLIVLEDVYRKKGYE